MISDFTLKFETNF